MTNRELNRRALEVYEEAGRVPNIAAVLLERRYGKEDARYDNLLAGRVAGIWAGKGLDVVSWPDYVLGRIEYYAKSLGNDHEKIADAIRREIKEDIGDENNRLGVTDETVRHKMKEKLGIEPAKKPRFGGGSPRRGNAAYTRKSGRRLVGEERKRYQFDVVPDAIGR